MASAPAPLSLTFTTFDILPVVSFRLVYFGLVPACVALGLGLLPLVLTLRLRCSLRRHGLTGALPTPPSAPSPPSSFPLSSSASSPVKQAWPRSPPGAPVPSAPRLLQHAPKPLDRWPEGRWWPAPRSLLAEKPGPEAAGDVDPAVQYARFTGTVVFRCYAWLTTGERYREMLLLFIETFKIVCILVLVLDFDRMAHYVCERHPDLLNAGLPQLASIGFVRADMRCDSEYTSEFAFPLLQAYAATGGNATPYEDMVAMYAHLCDYAQYAPPQVIIYFLAVLAFEVVTFVVLLAALPNLNMAGPRGAMRLNAAASLACALSLYVSAAVWAVIELFYSYRTNLGVDCHLSHEIWVLTRTLAVMYVLLGTFCLLPTAVKLHVACLIPPTHEALADEHVLAFAKKLHIAEGECVFHDGSAS
jgi:hypothetical protein